MASMSVLRKAIRARGVNVGGMVPVRGGNRLCGVPFFEVNQEKEAVVIKLRDLRVDRDRPIKICCASLRAAIEAVRDANLVSFASDQKAAALFAKLAKAGKKIAPR